MQNFVGDLHLNDFGEIKFRPLEIQDIPQIIQVGSYCFFHDNQAWSLMVTELADSQSFMVCTDLEKVLQQKLSFGAFSNNELISFAICQDFAIDVSSENYIPTKGAKNVLDTCAKIEKEYKKNQFKPGQCLFLPMLVTLPTSTRKNVATKCLNEVCKVAQQKGYQKFWTEAWHLGTKRIVEKNFNHTTIESEITEYDGKPVHLWGVSAAF